MQLIDHYPIDWDTHTTSLIRTQLDRDDGSQVYLLLDAAFRHQTALGLIKSLFKDNQWRSLFQDAPNTSESVLEVSPLLLEVTSAALPLLQQLRSETDGFPMLSMIVSLESMDNLWQPLVLFTDYSEAEPVLLTLRSTHHISLDGDTSNIIQTLITRDQRALALFKA